MAARQEASLIRTMNCTISDLPDDIMVRIFDTRLSFHDIRKCALVCQKWYCLTSGGYHWRKWIISALKRNKIDEQRYKVLEKIAYETSWKTAFLSLFALNTFKHPQFWNDVALFQFFQEHYTRDLPLIAQFGTVPCNGVIWIILQLKMTNTGVVSPVVENKAAQEYLRAGLLVISRHFGTKFVLEKLKEVAAVPSRAFLISESVRVSSLLLLQAAGSNDVCIEKVRPTWPTPASLFFDWKKHFVLPIQAAVIKAFQIWIDITCTRELAFTSAQQWLLKLLYDLESEYFWADKKLYESAIQLCHKFQRPLNPPPSIYITPPPLSLAFFDDSAQPKELATSLSSLSVSQFQAISESDLLSYLISSSHQWSCGSTRWFESEFGERLREPIMHFCSTKDHSKSKKAALAQRVISVCFYLKKLHDFRTLKTLISAVRAIVGQTNITGICWKDLKMKYLKMFKELEDLFSHKNDYRNYHRYVKQIDKGPSFVPYLPAHRHQSQLIVQESRLSAVILPKILSHISNGGPGSRKEQQCSIADHCLELISLKHLSRTFDMEELVVAQYVLQNFHR